MNSKRNSKRKSKMWLILRHKKGELKILQDEFKKKLGNIPEIFCPKIKISKRIKNKTIELKHNFLLDYIFVYDKKFSCKNLIKNFQNLRGLKSLLPNGISYQEEIKKFINLCKLNSDNEGCIKQSYFDNLNFKKGVFLNGPFAKIYFDVLENRKSFLKVIINQKAMTITKNKNFIYRPV